MTLTWSSRTYRNGDEKNIFELWKAVYPDKKYDYENWLRWWRWLYQKNPAGKSWIYLAEDNGKIVGQSALIPIMLNIGKDKLAAFQSVDAMTHPDYRRLGIFETLAKNAYSEAAKDGVEIGIRFPNENSHPIVIKKLDRFDVGVMKYVLKPLNWKNTLKTRIKNPVLVIAGTIGGTLLDDITQILYRETPVSGLTIEKVTVFDDSFDKLMANYPDRHPIMIARYKEFLNWKYVNCPAAAYSIYAAKNNGELEGYLVLKKTQQGNTVSGIILEVFSRSEKVAGYMVGEVIKSCRKENLDYLSYPYIGNRMIVKSLQKKGFIPIPFLSSWFSVFTTSPKYSKDYLRDPEKWLVQLGDSDVI